MKTIGGYFGFHLTTENENPFLQSLCPETGELAFLMSGRCAIYYALEDIMETDRIRVAYLPGYTCETVLAPFQKAGYELLFYDVDCTMTPVFDPAVLDRISVLLICGYYGFCNYDRDFVQLCKNSKIHIIEDTTHSIFSLDGVDPCCDYIAGSLRKWLGVAAGGFVIKTGGRFSHPLLLPDSVHLSMRAAAMLEKDTWSGSDKPAAMQKLDAATAVFWDAEMMLRRIFDSYGSDPDSVYIMNHIDVENIRRKRRDNYQYLLDNLDTGTDLSPVFPDLEPETVPSHFTFYTEKRRQVQDFLTAHGISSTVYWPENDLVNLSDYPGAAYIYSHVLSIPCDQRYGRQEMQYICDSLNQL